VPHGGVDEVDAAHQVVLVVEAADEMAEPLRRIGGEVIDVLEALLREEPVDQLFVSDGALDESGFGVHLVLEAATEIVQHHYAMAHGQQVLHHVCADEAGAAGNQGSRDGRH
jgi:hypothetical protein